ncbi:MAG: class I tRNA ligase family protein [Patescibacteria group bacterium]
MKNQALIHKTIKKVTYDLDDFRYNTAISQMMILVNAWDDQEKINKADFEKFIILISPFVPHLAEEIWEIL